MRTYIGKCMAGAWRVYVQDDETKRRWLLPMRRGLYNHSPAGFAWGYGGSGPAQLALALLADVLDDGEALKLHQLFKWKAIAPLEKDQDWRMTRDDILRHVEALRPQADAPGAP